MVALIQICDECGIQASFDDESFNTCQWCGRDLCLEHQISHDCSEIKDDES